MSSRPPGLYALAASNMILRGDGKANLYQGSCFDAAITKAVVEHKPNDRTINPPYAKSKADLTETRFVGAHARHPPERGCGHRDCAGVLRYSAVYSQKQSDGQHTLDAVMSMPPEIFSPVGVVTCIMVFSAGVAHSISDKRHGLATGATTDS